MKETTAASFACELGDEDLVIEHLRLTSGARQASAAVRDGGAVGKCTGDVDAAVGTAIGSGRKARERSGASLYERTRAAARQISPRASASCEYGAPVTVYVRFWEAGGSD
jgi:hypothetical protein